MARVPFQVLAAALVIILSTAPSRAQKAYVANSGDKTVSVISTATNTAGPLIPVGNDPIGVAVTPDGSKVYVANEGDNTVSVIATATNLLSAIVPVGNVPQSVAVTPDGSKVYVGNYGAASVSVIATTNNTVIGGPITVGANPIALAVTPDGSKVYVSNYVANTVSVITTATNTVMGTPTTVGTAPYGIAVSPDGSKVYVANQGDGTVSVIATATNTVMGTPITVGTAPTGVVVSPDGSKVYVTNGGSNTVSVIATATNTLMGAPITVGTSPAGVAVTPDGSKLYVVNDGSNNVLAIATATNMIIANIPVGHSPISIGSLIGPPTLNVAETGTGMGQITSSPTGINCSASSTACAMMFPDGTAVTLTASAASGSMFAGWSGGGCSGTAACVITPTADTAVTATFTLIPSFMLSVTSACAGSGTVTSAPSGISCGATCNASFQSGTQVILTAVAASGSTFSGWSGSGCSGIQTCNVMVSANMSVTANFVQNTTTNIALVAAVLPESRSVQLAATATAFATIINSGPGTGTTCTIAPSTSVPASFLFQTTDPTTNALTGTANTPVNIAQGVAQSFVIALTPTAPFTPTDVAFTFACANANPVGTLTGVNTLNLSGSTNPVPDIVALAASGDPGYVDIPGATGTGFFAVATVNLGISAAITASADTGAANLPLSFTLCQTNPATGACLAPPAITASTTIAANATPTFAIFVTGSAAVPNSPGVNRVFVRFTDSGGTLHGATSVAVRTQ